MKRLATYLMVPLFLVETAFLVAQTPEKLQPWFSLSIAEQLLAAENAPGTHLVQVTYTNISNMPQKDV